MDLFSHTLPRHSRFTRGCQLSLGDPTNDDFFGEKLPNSAPQLYIALLNSTLRSSNTLRRPTQHSIASYPKRFVAPLNSTVLDLSTPQLFGAFCLPVYFRMAIWVVIIFI